MLRRSDEWWAKKFEDIYGTTPSFLALQQFKKSYYIPEWGDPSENPKKGKNKEKKR